MTQSAQLMILPAEDLTDEQRAAVLILKSGCFSDVSTQEIEEDFYVPPIARLLLYENVDLVSYAAMLVREIEYRGQKVMLGGIGGVCTREDMRGKGFSTHVCTDALDFLRQAGCDVVFLSASPMARRLYEKLGFQALPAGFSWENIHGQIKTGTDGMLAPLCSPELADEIISGDTILHVGKGYW